MRPDRVPPRHPAALFLLALLAGLAVLSVPVHASAEEPVRLDTPGRLTDRAGVVDDPASVEAALERLATTRGVDLFVVFVGSFAPLGREAWLARTAELNGLGRDDLLLAVAVDDRQYGVQAQPGFPVADAAMVEVERRYIEPALRNGDWGGAAIAAADGYGRAVGGDLAGGGGGTGRGAGAGLPGWLVPAALLAGGGAILFMVLQRNRVKVHPPAGGPPEPVDPDAGVPTEELGRRAAELLVAMDSELVSARFDVDRAAMEFGEEQARPFREALASARSELGECFTLQATLGEPSMAEPERRRTMRAIIDRVEAADARLDAESDRFEALRDRAGRAPEILDRLEAELPDLQGRVDRGEAELAALRSRHPAAALDTVEANVADARERSEFARTTIADGRAALAEGDANRAALDTSAVEEAIGSALGLLDGVTRLGADLDAAAVGLDPLLDDLRRDLAEAEAVQGATGAPSPVLAGAVGAARQVLGEVDAARAAGPVDPLAVTRRIQQAAAPLESALGEVRERAEQAERARGMLERTLPAARSRVESVADFIAGRRGAVGAEARTRISEAQRYLAEATSRASTDPSAALDAATTASRLADEAAQLARNDVDRWQGGGHGRHGGRVDLGGLILGGILIDSMGRGGRGGRVGHGGWGGRSTGGFGGGFSGGGSFGGGGFSGGGRF